MNIALWVVTVGLAWVALMGGLTKTFVPKEKLAEHEGGRWTERVSTRFVRTLGILELLAAVGLILPAVTGVAPVMVPVTAACWVLLMVGAAITHGRLGQGRYVLLNLLYLAMAAFVAFGRFGPERFVS